MAFPPQYREPPPTLPSIIAPDSGRFRAHHDSMHLGRSPAISIPGLEPKEDVPPPLPPPRFLSAADAPLLSEDFKRDHRPRTHASSLASGYGSMGSSYADDRPHLRRRDTGGMTSGADEGYASYASTERSRDSLPVDIGLRHAKFHFQTPADLYTDTIMRKLNPRRAFDKSPPRSLLASSTSDVARTQADARLPPTLNMPVQLPMRSRSILESPGRMPDSSIYSAASPMSAAPFHHSPVDYRLHCDVSDVDRSPRGRTRRNNSDDASSTQGSYEFTGAEDMEIDESSSMRRLRIDDAYAAAGQKRRAASPPAEDSLLQCITGQGDALRRRDAASRGSPTCRLSAVSQSSPASSVPPATASRSSSYMSTVSMAPASMTPANSFGRRSPGGTSPGGISPTSCSSPYPTPASLTHSPRASLSGRVSTHGRAATGASPRKLDVQKPGSSKLQGFFMCDCCPKKPKKFETVEELGAHEAEKQYECLFCGNRFKNKNEAERHQNSLHVRRHSWSCSALSGYDRAFHDSANRPGEADTCGYCGDEFPRSGHGPGNGGLSGGIVPRHATEQDWDQRIRHLQDMHKFRECNAAKKFYRADHFRQHLKHSHAGTSGKWTNMLENACMMEEDPSPR